MTAGLVAAIMSAPAAGAQPSSEDNLAVVDVGATADLLERVTSVIEQVMSYDYRELAGREALIAELATDHFEEDQGGLFDQVGTVAPAQQITLTSTVVDSAARSIVDDEAEVLVFLDQSSFSGVTQKEATVTAMFLASFERSDGEWLLDEIDALGAA